MGDHAKVSRINFYLKNKIFQIYNDGILRAPRKGGQHIYIIYHGTVFEQILFMVNFVVTIAFCIYDFTNPEFVGAKTIQLDYVVATISLIGNVTDIMSIILSSKKRISTFAGGVIACTTLGITSFIIGAIGTAVVYVIIQMPMQFVGFYLWRRSSVNKIQVQPKKMKGWSITMTILIVAGLTTGFYFIEAMPSFQKFGNGSATNMSVFSEIDDSLILVLGTAGMILMIMAYREQWIVGIILDIALLVLFSINFNAQMVALAITSLINGFYGVGNGRKDTKLKDYE